MQDAVAGWMAGPWGGAAILRGRAAARGPEEDGAGAGLPAPDTAPVPGSVEPPPQTWGPLFAEPKLTPPRGSGTGVSCWLSCP